MPFQQNTYYNIHGGQMSQPYQMSETAPQRDVDYYKQSTASHHRSKEKEGIYFQNMNFAYPTHGNARHGSNDMGSARLVWQTPESRFPQIRSNYQWQTLPQKQNDQYMISQPNELGGLKSLAFTQGTQNISNQREKINNQRENIGRVRTQVSREEKRRQMNEFRQQQQEIAYNKELPAKLQSLTLRKALPTTEIDYQYDADQARMAKLSLQLLFAKRNTIGKTNMNMPQPIHSSNQNVIYSSQSNHNNAYNTEQTNFPFNNSQRNRYDNTRIYTKPDRIINPDTLIYDTNDVMIKKPAYKNAPSHLQSEPFNENNQFEPNIHSKPNYSIGNGRLKRDSHKNEGNPHSHKERTTQPDNGFKALPNNTFESKKKEENELKERLDTPEVLYPCKMCGRSFNDVALERHQVVCGQAKHQKRKQFNSKTQRLADEVVTIDRPTPRNSKTDKGSSWRTESEQFRAMLKQHRGQTLTSDEQATLNAPRDTDYIKCDYCGRSFNQQAGPRHVEFCKQKSQNIHQIKQPRRR